MPTSNRIFSRAKTRGVLYALLVAAACASGPALALDDVKTPTNATASLEMFKNPIQALRQGIETYRSGDAASSIDALTYAAAGGQPLAQWKLGRMYASGDGVPHDDLKAYNYFLQIVESYDEDTADMRERSVYSSAFVSVGVYALKGIPSAQMAPDPERALEMFKFAAMNFGDPNAQYNLARMYLDGDGIKQDGWQAARWLHLAAEKRHAEAQAILGHLLFTGQAGVVRQRARGLMWLTLARDAATEAKKDEWIIELYDTAIKAANDTDRQVASVYLEGHHKKP